MVAAVLRTEGLTAYDGNVDALSHLDLEVPAGEGPGYLGPTVKAGTNCGGAERRRSENGAQ
jgi:hypothetical protein